MFAEIDQIRQFLQASVSTPQLAEYDQTQTDNDISETTEEIVQKIEKLDDLEQQLDSRENADLIQQIRQLRSNLIEVLQGQTDRFSGTLYDSDESPLIRRMGIAEYQKYIFRS